MISSSCEPAGDGSDVSDEDPGDGAGDCRLEVFGEPAASAEPCECAFDDPSARKHFEALRLVGTLDDLDGPSPKCGERSAQLFAGIAAVGEDVTQPRIERTDRSQDADSAVAILDIGRVNPQTYQVSGGVGNDVALAALEPDNSAFLESPAF